MTTRETGCVTSRETGCVTSRDRVNVTLLSREVVAMTTKALTTSYLFGQCVVTLSTPRLATDESISFKTSSGSTKNLRHI